MCVLAARLLLSCKFGASLLALLLPAWPSCLVLLAVSQYSGLDGFGFVWQLRQLFHPCATVGSTLAFLGRAFAHLVYVAASARLANGLHIICSTGLAAALWAYT